MAYYAEKQRADAERTKAVASEATTNPGEMAPPRYSPSGDTTSNVVAVPKSITMAGPPYRTCAAIVFTMR